jgi:selenocysteine-specific elongation factor
MMKHIILGTAGHIDHGKSSLVRAMTGTDPDRLKEEKERGITIDLGFADLAWDDLAVGIVDVPGHERLIKNMLAGAGGIDMVLLVIAADEGVMPQSREHLAICDLLGIEAGIIVITKSDTVEADWLELVESEVRQFVRGTFLENAETVAVSSKTGANIPLLKEKIRLHGLRISPKSDGGIFRLPVDRVFTMKGFGTVVTGTVVSGSIDVDEVVEFAQSGLKCKVRGLHSHGRAIGRGSAGRRLAVNLQGVEKDDVRRGDVLVRPDTLLPALRFDAEVTLLKNAPAVKGGVNGDAPPRVKNGALVHFYCGTSELTARVILYEGDRIEGGGRAFCQFRFKSPAALMAGDRFIVRRLSPLETIGGGVALDPRPPLKKRRQDASFLKVYRDGALDEKLAERIRRSGTVGVSSKSLTGWINADVNAIKTAAGLLKSRGEVVDLGDVLMHSSEVLKVKEQAIALVGEFHAKNPLRAGMPVEELKGSFRAVEGKIFLKIIASAGEFVQEKELIRFSSFTASMSLTDEGAGAGILKSLKDAGFQPPTKDELSKSFKMPVRQVEDLLKHLSAGGGVVRINDSIYLHKDTYEKMIEMLKEFSKGKKDITVAEFRDMVGTSRKYALPFLEMLDTKKVTLRVGDSRKILIG